MSSSLQPHGPGSSVHGILQARIVEWVAISFSRGSSQPRDWTCVSRHLLHCHLWRPYKSEDETEVTVTLNLHKGHEGNLGGDKAVTYLNCDASHMTAFCQNSELLDFTPKFSQLSIKLLIFSQNLLKQRSICILYSYFYTTVIKYPRKMDPIWNIVQTENYREVICWFILTFIFKNTLRRQSIKMINIIIMWPRSQ